MTTPTAIAATVNYIFLNATRGGLEDRTSWYFDGIGKPGYKSKASRPTLETIYFIANVLDLASDGVYQMKLDGTIYKQTYLSGAEVIKHIMKNCEVSISKDWKEFRTSKGQLVSVRHVAIDKGVTCR